MTYPDTSILCALYVPQSTSPKAFSFMNQQLEPLVSTSLLLFEFRQSVHFQAYRHGKDPGQGYPWSIAKSALGKLQSNAAAGVFRHTAADWADVHSIADRLAGQYTLKGGHRSFDILHVATALHLGVTKFLTFDGNQKKLAEAEGLLVPL